MLYMSFMLAFFVTMCVSVAQAKVVVLNKSDFEIKVLVKWYTGDVFHHIKDWEAFPNVKKPKPVNNNRKLDDAVPGLQPFVGEDTQRNDARNYTKSDGSYIKDNIFVWANIPSKGWQQVAHRKGSWTGGAVHPVVVTVSSRVDNEGNPLFDLNIEEGR
jgi:hypothetical protein